MGNLGGPIGEAQPSITRISISEPKPLAYINYGDIITEDDFKLYSKKYKFYAITIKPCSTVNKLKYQKNPQGLSDLAIELGKVNKFSVNELHFEYTEEKKNGRYPHIHLTAIKTGCLMRFYQKGFSIYIEPIYNFTNWMSYCKKDQLPQNEYMFVPEFN